MYLVVSGTKFSEILPKSLLQVDSYGCTGKDKTHFGCLFLKDNHACKSNLAKLKIM